MWHCTEGHLSDLEIYSVHFHKIMLEVTCHISWHPGSRLSVYAPGYSHYNRGYIPDPYQVALPGRSTSVGGEALLRSKMRCQSLKVCVIWIFTISKWYCLRQMCPFLLMCIPGLRFCKGLRKFSAPCHKIVEPGSVSRILCVIWIERSMLTQHFFLIFSPRDRNSDT